MRLSGALAGAAAARSSAPKSPRARPLAKVQLAKWREALNSPVELAALARETRTSRTRGSIDLSDPTAYRVLDSVLATARGTTREAAEIARALPQLLIASLRPPGQNQRIHPAVFAQLVKALPELRRFGPAEMERVGRALAKGALHHLAPAYMGRMLNDVSLALGPRGPQIVGSVLSQTLFNNGRADADAALVPKVCAAAAFVAAHSERPDELCKWLGRLSQACLTHPDSFRGSGAAFAALGAGLFRTTGDCLETHGAAIVKSAPSSAVLRALMGAPELGNALRKSVLAAVANDGTPTSRALGLSHAAELYENNPSAFAAFATAWLSDATSEDASAAWTSAVAALLRPDRSRISGEALVKLLRAAHVQWTVAMCTTLLAHHVRKGDRVRARALADAMVSGPKGDLTLLRCVLWAVAPDEARAREVLKVARERWGVEIDASTLSTVSRRYRGLLSGFNDCEVTELKAPELKEAAELAKNGRLEEFEAIWRRLVKLKDTQAVEAWTMRLQAHSVAGRRTDRLLVRMEQAGVRPSEATWVVLISECAGKRGRSSEKRLARAERFYRRSRLAGVSFPVELAMLDVYQRCDAMDQFWALWTRIWTRGVPAAARAAVADAVDSASGGSVFPVVARGSETGDRRFISQPRCWEAFFATTIDAVGFHPPADSAAQRQMLDGWLFGVIAPLSTALGTPQGDRDSRPRLSDNIVCAYAEALARSEQFEHLDAQLAGPLKDYVEMPKTGPFLARALAGRR